MIRIRARSFRFFTVVFITLLPAVGLAEKKPPPVEATHGASTSVVAEAGSGFLEIRSSSMSTDTTTYFNESLTINALCNQGDGDDCPFVLTSETVAVPEGRMLVIDYIAAFPGSSTNSALRPILSIRIGGCLVFVGRTGSEGMGKRVLIPSLCSGSVSGFSASLSFSASGSRPSPTAFGAGGPSFQQIIRATGRIVDNPPTP